MKKLVIAILMIVAMVGVASAQTFYSLRSRTHATDCTALTDGKINDICFEVDDETLYKCEPDAGDCTGTEWKFIGGAETVTKCILIETPADADDFLMYHVEKGAQVVAVHCIVEDATSATLSFEQCDVAG
ncbi:MAG TPA: hypothetical protein VMV86_01375, partial [Methanosarcinales archaeon]|nr:hypothetical protein [Methanosarcinales archaeon]